MDTIKALTLAAIMGALANVLALPPIAIFLTIGSFQSEIHFSQMPILIAGTLGGPTVGLVTGAIGGLFMGVYLPGIPFIVVGLAILGFTNGFYGRKLRPLYSGTLAWCTQAPYVLVTDYVWFTLFLERTPAAAWTILTTIMIKLTIEALVSAVLTDILIQYLDKTGIATRFRGIIDGKN